jgi:glycosyltransferase involved in cell wall biosynthesis
LLSRTGIRIMTSSDMSTLSRMPKISVVTVVFNGKESIGETINSVLAQDYPCIEYIVIDGDSTDGTRDIIEKYRARLNRYVSENDGGVYDAMNKALRLANGDFIMFMNCGDVFSTEQSLSAAMSNLLPQGEQILFGDWLRREKNSEFALCKASIPKGRFHHQATIYSRSIHSWHGEYNTVDGLTTADYLFFASLFDSGRVMCRTIDATIAIIDLGGISNGSQTLSQKYAIDFICGRSSKWALVMVLILHPFYRFIKTKIGRRS